MHRPIQLTKTTSSCRTSISRSPSWPRMLLISPLAAVMLLLLLSAASTAFAGSATWNLNPGSGDWNTASNWTPMTVPDGSGDIATLDLSNTTSVSLSANTEVGGIVFTQAAIHSYTINASPGFTLILSGAGITNNSGATQNFATGVNAVGSAGFILFKNAATAGSETFFTNNGSAIFGVFGGQTQFSNTATASNGTFTNNGGSVSGAGGGFTVFNSSATAGNGAFTNNAAMAISAGVGRTDFFDTSDAANSTFTNNGSTVSGAGGGLVRFFDNSTAGNATISNNGGTVSGPPNQEHGGAVAFLNNSTAGSATLIAMGGTGGGDGGIIFFENNSAGGTARVEVFGNGNLEISLHEAPGVTVGSIEGNGNVFLGANKLTVGSNNLSTLFSGVAQDGGLAGGTGGSLTKVGAGVLDLMGANTYTGNTNINGGVLKVDGSVTSNTLVNRDATFTGTGTVHGSVTNNNGATVSPGDSPGTLTVNSYTQKQWGTLLIDIAGSGAGQSSLLDDLGDATLDGYLSPVLLDGFIPEIGDSFTIMSYSHLIGEFSRIQGQVFDDRTKQWNISYEPTFAVLTVGANTIPDQGSTLLLLTLSLGGLLICYLRFVTKARMN
jgi:autotransporter-associated beta strand protein